MCVLGEPCHTGTFESFLDDLFVGAFDHAGTHRHTLSQGTRVIELMASGGEITVSDADRGLLLGHAERLTFSFEFVDELMSLALEQFVFLTPAPAPGTFFLRAGVGGGPEVLKYVIEVQDKGRARKTDAGLLLDPFGPVAHGLQMGMGGPSGPGGGQAPELAGSMHIDDAAFVVDGGLSPALGGAQARLFPFQAPLLACIARRCGLHRADHRSVALSGDRLGSGGWQVAHRSTLIELPGHFLALPQSRLPDALGRQTEAVVALQTHRREPERLFEPKIRHDPGQGSREPATADAQCARQQSQVALSRPPPDPFGYTDRSEGGVELQRFFSRWRTPEALLWRSCSAKASSRRSAQLPSVSPPNLRTS